MFLQSSHKDEMSENETFQHHALYYSENGAASMMDMQAINTVTTEPTSCNSSMILQEIKLALDVPIEKLLPAMDKHHMRFSVPSKVNMVHEVGQLSVDDKKFTNFWQISHTNKESIKTEQNEKDEKSITKGDNNDSDIQAPKLIPAFQFQEESEGGVVALTLAEVIVNTPQSKHLLGTDSEQQKNAENYSTQTIQKGPPIAGIQTLTAMSFQIGLPGIVLLIDFWYDTRQPLYLRSLSDIQQHISCPYGYLCSNCSQAKCASSRTYHETLRGLKRKRKLPRMGTYCTLPWPPEANTITNTGSYKFFFSEYVGSSKPIILAQQNHGGKADASSAQYDDPPMAFSDVNRSWSTVLSTAGDCNISGYLEW